MRGIGGLDGLFVNRIVENNVVITDHWHGISSYGMRDSLIANDNVIDLAVGQPGPPWIMMHGYKDDRPSEWSCATTCRPTIRSKARRSRSIKTWRSAMRRTLFVAPPFDLHLLPGAAAIDDGSATFAPSLDADGVARPQGAGIDLGAYEWRADVIFLFGFDGT